MRVVEVPAFLGGLASGWGSSVGRNRVGTSHGGMRAVAVLLRFVIRNRPALRGKRIMFVNISDFNHSHPDFVDLQYK